MMDRFHVALQDLKLDKLFVIYPGKEQCPLQENVTVLPIEKLIGLDDVVTW